MGLYLNCWREEACSLFPHSHELVLSLNTPIFLPFALLAPSLAEFELKNQTWVSQHPLFLGAGCPWEAHGHLLFSAMISGGSPDMRGSLGFHSLEPDRCVWSPEPSSRSSVSKKKKKRTVDLISLTHLCLSAGLEPGLGKEIMVTLHTSSGHCLCYSRMS